MQRYSLLLDYFKYRINYCDIQ